MRIGNKTLDRTQWKTKEEIYVQQWTTHDDDDLGRIILIFGVFLLLLQVLYRAIRIHVKMEASVCPH